MRRILIATALSLVVSGAQAQETTTEDKLRDALRRSTVELRALQDGQAQLQADRDGAVKQRDLLQQQLTDAQAKLATAKPAAPPVDDEKLAKAMAALDAAQRQVRGLQSANAALQGQLSASQAALASKTAEAKQLDANLKRAVAQDATEHATNKRLVGVSTDILHLYETQDFQATLTKSYEPLLGLWRVRRDNIVQDWDDKIAAQTIYPAPTH